MRPTFTIDYTLTVDGEPSELFEKLSLWIENKFYEGRVDNDSFTIKERGKGLYEKMTDATHIDLVTTIAGQLQNNKKIKLSAELNSGPKIQVYLIRALIIFFGLAMAMSNFDWLYNTLTLFVTTVLYFLNNRLTRERVKKDLDGFIWTINNKLSTKLK